MRIKKLHIFGLSLVLAGPLVAGSVPVQARGGATVTVLASGLNNPRGLQFGPDGQLYVAEGGLGGTLYEHRRAMPAGSATDRA